MQDNKQQPKRSEDMPEQQAQPGTDTTQEIPRRPDLRSPKEFSRYWKELCDKTTPEEWERINKARKTLEELGVFRLADD